MADLGRFIPGMLNSSLLEQIAAKAKATTTAATPAQATPAKTTTAVDTGSIGKVTTDDGSLLADGKKANISTLVLNLMLKRVHSVDGVLAGMLNQMDANTVSTQNMNNFLKQLREMRPTSADGTVSKNRMTMSVDIVYKDSGKKISPKTSWGLDLNKDKYTQGQIDQLIEVMKSKISTVNSNQQMEQIKLQKYNNVRNESMQMVSTVMKMQMQSLQSIVNNMS